MERLNFTARMSHATNSTPCIFLTETQVLMLEASGTTPVKQFKLHYDAEHKSLTLNVVANGYKIGTSNSHGSTTHRISFPAMPELPKFGIVDVAFEAGLVGMYNAKLPNELPKPRSLNRQKKTNSDVEKMLKARDQLLEFSRICGAKLKTSNERGNCIPIRGITCEIVTEKTVVQKVMVSL